MANRRLISAQPNHAMMASFLGPSDKVGVTTITIDRKTMDTTEETISLGADICFLLDTSGSMAGSRARKMASELEYFIYDSKQLEDNDFIEIVSFNSSKATLLKPTRYSKIKENKSAIRDLGIATMGSAQTYMWTAISDTLQEREAYIAAKKKAILEAHKKMPKQKAYILLILTDGEATDSAVAPKLKDKLKHLGHNVPHFHCTLLGVDGMTFELEAIAKDVLSGSKHAEVVNLTGNGGSHVESAIQEGFRTQFVKTVTKVRHEVRQIKVSQDGRGGAPVFEVLPGKVSQMKLGDVRRSPSPACKEEPHLKHHPVHHKDSHSPHPPYPKGPPPPYRPTKAEDQKGACKFFNSEKGCNPPVGRGCHYDHIKVCKFFNLPSGCNKGSGCTFRHIKYGN